VSSFRTTSPEPHVGIARDRQVTIGQGFGNLAGGRPIIQRLNVGSGTTLQFHAVDHRGIRPALPPDEGLQDGAHASAGITIAVNGQFRVLEPARSRRSSWRSFFPRCRHQAAAAASQREGRVRRCSRASVISARACRGSAAHTTPASPGSQPASARSRPSSRPIPSPTIAPDRGQGSAAHEPGGPLPAQGEGADPLRRPLGQAAPGRTGTQSALRTRHHPREANDGVGPASPCCSNRPRAPEDGNADRRGPGPSSTGDWGRRRIRSGFFRGSAHLRAADGVRNVRSSGVVLFGPDADESDLPAGEDPTLVRPARNGRAAERNPSGLASVPGPPRREDQVPRRRRSRLLEHAGRSRAERTLAPSFAARGWAGANAPDWRVPGRPGAAGPSGRRRGSAPSALGPESGPPGS